jgi:hypothetical protein
MTTPEPTTASQIQQEIEHTREQLGETVEELAAKADVKARARDKADEVKAKAQNKATEARAKAQNKATEARAKAQSTATAVSAQVNQSEFLQRRWPLAAAAAAGVALISAIVIWRRRKA